MRKCILWLLQWFNAEASTDQPPPYNTNNVRRLRLTLISVQLRRKYVYCHRKRHYNSPLWMGGTITSERSSLVGVTGWFEECSNWAYANTSDRYGASGRRALQRLTSEFKELLLNCTHMGLTPAVDIGKGGGSRGELCSPADLRRIITLHKKAKLYGTSLALLVCMN